MGKGSAPLRAPQKVDRALLDPDHPRVVTSSYSNIGTRRKGSSSLLGLERPSRVVEARGTADAEHERGVCKNEPICGQKENRNSEASQVFVRDGGDASSARTPRGTIGKWSDPSA